MLTEDGISFDDSSPKFKSRIDTSVSATPWMVRFLVNKGIIKNERQAMIIIAVFSVLLIVLSLFLIRRSVSVPSAQLDAQFINNNQ